MKSVDGSAKADDLVGAWIEAAEASGEIRVLRRLAPARYAPRIEAPGIRLGLCVDVEATGLDTGTDEIVELAMLPFSYDRDHRIVAVHEPFEALNEPSRPIPAVVTALTGIDAAAVRGHAIRVEDVEAFAASAAVVIAHNSSYDRRLLERFAPIFRTKPWACTVEDASWAEEGVESAKLAYVAAAFGLFADVRHRAVEDCRLLLEVLSRSAPVTGGTMLGKVLTSARRGRIRVSAHGPFSAKDALKAAGYRWHPGGSASDRPKCWFKDVLDEFAVAVEREHLACVRPPCRDRRATTDALDAVLRKGLIPVLPCRELAVDNRDFVSSEVPERCPS